LRRAGNLESILRSSWKSLKGDYEQLLRRMERSRDEVDKFAMAQHMVNSEAHFTLTNAAQNMTHGMTHLIKNCLQKLLKPYFLLFRCIASKPKATAQDI